MASCIFTERSGGNMPNIWPVMTNLDKQLPPPSENIRPAPHAVLGDGIYISRSRMSRCWSYLPNWKSSFDQQQLGCLIWLSEGKTKSASTFLYIYTHTYTYVLDVDMSQNVPTANPKKQTHCRWLQGLWCPDLTYRIMYCCIWQRTELPSQPQWSLQAIELYLHKQQQTYLIAFSGLRLFRTRSNNQSVEKTSFCEKGDHSPKVLWWAHPLIQPNC